MNMNNDVRPALVADVNTIVVEWRNASRRIREMLHGWEQRGALAGLERAAMGEMGRLRGAYDFAPADTASDEIAGRCVFEAWGRGNLIAAVDIARS